MATKRCSNGHHFDPTKHASCPLCRKVDFGASRTEALSPSAGPPVTPQVPPRVGGQTVALYAAQSGTAVDPVVGWLVCTAGPDRGRDFRLHSERNFIGRAPEMDVSIPGDQTISRERHAVLTYNPKTRGFKVAPGEARGLTFLNSEEVETPTAILRGDRLEIGKTELMLVPLCGEDFDWSQDD
ncbi:MAG: FHA domain-containing protein [Bdellovibrionales bacterium]|nr:FHA domain-containing protein [Bdellovibrionales bacterium]